MGGIMTDLVARQGFGGRFFYPTMALMCLIISLLAFVPTYFGPISTGEYVSPSLWMHAHAGTSFAWLLLFVLQPTLIASGNASLHRKIGVFGIAIAGAALASGFLVLQDTMPLAFEYGNVRVAETLPVLRVLALVCFAGFVTAALYFRRSPDYHKRLIFIATLWLAQAPFLRFWENVAGLDAAVAGPMILVLQVTLLVLAAMHDKRTQGRVHSVYRWWIPLTIIINIVVVGLSETEASRAMVRAIAGV